MDVGDVQFRIGLIVAVIVLASTFASGVYLLMDRSEEADAKGMARTLGRALETLSPVTGTTSLRIEFRDGSGEGIRLDPLLGGEYFTIHVLPSLIYIQWSEGREIVSEAEGIIPAYGPCAIDGASPPLDDLGIACEGFELRTPCTMLVEQMASNGSIYSLVHPPEEAWMANVTDLSMYLNDDRLPAPGGFTRHIMDPEGPVKVRDRWLSFSEEEGSCPYPVWVPASWNIDLREGSVGGRITAEVRCGMVSGNLTIIRTVG